MHKKISRWIMTVAVIFSALHAAACNDGPDKWRDNMRSEMVAFLTTETGITSAEAEKFWPVYNEFEQARKAAFKGVMQAYEALDEAVKSNLAAEEIEKRIALYLDAQRLSREIDGQAVGKYLQILPAEKVARLLLAEEKFRRNQINRLHERSGNTHNGGRPGPGKRTPGE